MGTTSIERCLSKALDILTVRPSRKTMVLVALLMLQATAFFGAGNIVAKDITGKVTSATDNEPLIGATVQVEGSQGGTITDFDGNYKIKADDGQTLVFTYIGYVTKKVKVKGNICRNALIRRITRYQKVLAKGMRWFTEIECQLNPYFL